MKIPSWSLFLALSALGAGPAHAEDSGGWVRLEAGELRPVYGVQWIVRLSEPEPLDIHPSQWTTPLISADSSLTFVGTEQGVLHALWTESGKELWKRRDLGKLGRAFGQVEDTLLAGADGALYGLETYSGKERWHVDLGGVVGGDVVSTGTIAIVPVRPNGYAAIDTRAGKVLWRVKRPKPEGITVHGQAPALIDRRGGRVFLGSSDGFVLAVQLADGEALWSAKISSAAQDEPFGDVDTRAVFTDGGARLVAASYNGGLAGLDAATGQIAWRNEALLHVTSLVEVPGARWLVASVGDGQVVGVDPANGRVRWRYKLAKGVPSQPVALDAGLVAVGSSHGPLAILESLNGRPLQVVTPGSGLSANPYARGRHLAVWTNKGFALGLELGEGP